MQHPGIGARAGHTDLEVLLGFRPMFQCSDRNTASVVVCEIVVVVQIRNVNGGVLKYWQGFDELAGGDARLDALCEAVIV